MITWLRLIIKSSSDDNACILQFEREIVRNSRPEVVLWKGVLKICIKFTGEHPWRSAISVKWLCNFIEITLWHGCSPVNLLYIFRTPFHRNISGSLLLNSQSFKQLKIWPSQLYLLGPPKHLSRRV